MKRLTMFFVITALSVVMIAFAGCESAKANSVAASTEIERVLHSNEQTVLFVEVTAIPEVRSGLLSNETTYRARSAPTVRSVPFRYQDTQMSHAPPYESLFARVKSRPKLSKFNGIGYNHFARADV